MWQGKFTDYITFLRRYQFTRLIISEKPSVGKALSKVLGCASRHDGYMEGGDWIVSWCVGHLVDTAPPDAYDPRYSKWDCADLPIIPKVWKYQTLPDTKKQYDILTALMLDDRVESIVSATDAGREGELIFRLVYNQCGCEKPVQRLWLSSMEESAIRKGLENLKDSAEYDRLGDAAFCRQKADWLIGMNGTRLFTKLYGGKTLRVGRVMTPTLVLLVERETAVAGFKKQKFYTVELDLRGFQAVSQRFQSKTEAEKLRSSCLNRNATVVSVDEQRKTENPPKLYDLTSLQREANRMFDYTAQQTLDCLQSLYENRLATYPRTDSRYLTDDMEAGLSALCRMSERLLRLSGDSSVTVNAARVIDNSKVTDHHAVIPTARSGDADISALPTGEKNILSLLAARLLCAVGEPHEYLETAVTLECGGVSFTAKGKTELAPGWKAIQREFWASMKKKKEEAAVSLPRLAEGEVIENVGAAVKEGVTTPPARFTEDTLLAAMERAGAEDFAQIENPERAGLGTPATRARTIEKLIENGFAERKKKQLVPTEKGMDMIRAVPDALKSVKLTAEWEEKLSEVERGTLDPAVFMSGIASLLEEIVGTCRTSPPPASSALSRRSDRPAVGKCPRCGGNVIEGQKSFFCEGWYATPRCEFALWKNNPFFLKKKKELTKGVVAPLLKDGRIHMTGLYSERTGGLYDATVVMEDTGDKFVHFKLEFDNSPKKSNRKGN